MYNQEAVNWTLCKPGNNVQAIAVTDNMVNGFDAAEHLISTQQSVWIVLGGLRKAQQT